MILSERNVLNDWRLPWRHAMTSLVVSLSHYVLWMLAFIHLILQLSYQDGTTSWNRLLGSSPPEETNLCQLIKPRFLPPRFHFHVPSYTWEDVTNIVNALVNGECKSIRRAVNVFRVSKINLVETAPKNKIKIEKLCQSTINYEVQLQKQHSRTRFTAPLSQSLQLPKCWWKFQHPELSLDEA